MVEKSEKYLPRASHDEKHYHGAPDGSSIVEGSEGVTEYELATLRHVADRLPYTSWLVVICEFAERCVHKFYNLLHPHEPLQMELLRNDKHLQQLHSIQTSPWFNNWRCS